MSLFTSLLDSPVFDLPFTIFIKAPLLVVMAAMSLFMLRENLIALIQYAKTPNSSAYFQLIKPYVTGVKELIEHLFQSFVSKSFASEVTLTHILLVAVILALIMRRV